MYFFEFEPKHQNKILKEKIANMSKVGMIISMDVLFDNIAFRVGMLCRLIAPERF